MTMPLLGSTPQGGGISLRSFGVGRLVLIFPKEEYTGHAFGKPTEPKQFIRANVVALPDPQSAPYMTFGGEANNDGVSMKTPDTMRIDLGPHGYMAENMSIGGGGMLFILRRVMKQQSAIVGRLWKDPAHGDAWKVKDATPEEMAIAQNWNALYASDQFVNSPVRQIAGIPQQQAAPVVQPQYAPPQQQWTQPVQQQPMPQQPAYAGQAPAQYAQPQGQPQWPIQPAPQGPPPGWGQPQQPQGWPQQQAPADHPAGY